MLTKCDTDTPKWAQCFNTFSLQKASITRQELKKTNLWQIKFQFPWPSVIRSTLYIIHSKERWTWWRFYCTSPVLCQSWAQQQWATDEVGGMLQDTLAFPGCLISAWQLADCWTAWWACSAQKRKVHCFLVYNTYSMIPAFDYRSLIFIWQSDTVSVTS